MTKKEAWNPIMISGGIATLAGVIALVWLAILGMASPLLLGILLCVVAASKLLVIYGNGKAITVGGMSATSVTAATGILLIVMRDHPFAITIILSAYFLASGLIRFALSTLWYKFKYVWTICLLSVVVALAFAASIWLNKDGTMHWLNGTLVGADLVIVGVATLVASRHQPDK